jgi:hypothetical protein
MDAWTKNFGEVHGLTKAGCNYQVGEVKLKYREVCEWILLPLLTSTI